MGDEKISRFELLKLSFDWCKHVSTLSTGSLLLMVTFLEKLKAQPSWKFLLPIALLGFVAAILGTLAVQLEHLITEDYDAKPTFLGKFGMRATPFGFLVGIVFVLVFALKNLF